MAEQFIESLISNGYIDDDYTIIESDRFEILLLNKIKTMLDTLQIDGMTILLNLIDDETLPNMIDKVRDCILTLLTIQTYDIPVFDNEKKSCLQWYFDNNLTGDDQFNIIMKDIKDILLYYNDKHSHVLVWYIELLRDNMVDILRYIVTSDTHLYDIDSTLLFTIIVSTYQFEPYQINTLVSLYSNTYTSYLLAEWLGEVTKWYTEVKRLTVQSGQVMDHALVHSNTD